MYGEKVDAIDYYDSEIDRLTEEALCPSTADGVQLFVHKLNKVKMQQSG
jgi:hypothetical protein